MLKKFHILIIFEFLLLFIPTDCDRKSKRDQKLSIPKYDIYPSNNLPSDTQITTYLHKSESKLFFFDSTTNQGALSATLITCSSPIRWSMHFSPTNNTESLTIMNNFDGLTTTEMTTKHLTAQKGLYILQLFATKRNTFAHIYISTEVGGPQALQSSKRQNLKLIKRQRRKRLTVKWEPSLVDPQGTDYCLVVNTKKQYNSLCAAQSDKYGIIPSNHTDSQYNENNLNKQPQNPLIEDPLIACVGKKNQFTLSELKQGQSYYFNLFAINHQSNLTYPFASASTVFDKHLKPITLKDAKPNYINLKKYDGKVVLRFKIGRKSTGNSLNIFLIPCGGAVNIEITLKEEIVLTRRKIEGFGELVIDNPVEGTRYYIKIFASSREELRKINGVEIYATTKSMSKIPLPRMPMEPKVEEYVSLRKCDSVTVGWLSVPDPKNVHYCLVVKEGKIREFDDYKMPNQCGLENRLRKSADFVVKYCKDYKQDNNVITQKIGRLKPGRSYIVQVTVKKPRGKTLSYDLLQVYTRPSCNRKELL